MKDRVEKLLAVLLLLLTLCGAAAAEGEAQNIAPKCWLSVSSNKGSRTNLVNGGLRDYWPCAPGDTITVETPEGTRAQGVMVSFLGDVPELTVESDGRVIAEFVDGFVTDYIPFAEPVSSFTITIGDGPESIHFKRLQVYSEGELPDTVQRWEWMEGPADIMLIATHPDDELLWFGGLLPTYAGEYQKKVIVVYTVGSSDFRRPELLAGLWTCGVRYYPEIGNFPDRNAKALKEYVEMWGGEDAPRQFIVEMIRKYRPSVVVTQDIDGELGHTHHRMTVQAVIDAVTELSGDAAWDAPSAELYGAWQPHKLYLHLWEEDRIVFDWRQPLEAFGGENSLSVAKRAFKMHGSQQSGRYSVKDSGRTDCRIMGLYWSDVGPDEVHNDLLEHIE